MDGAGEAGASEVGAAVGAHLGNLVGPGVVGMAEIALGLNVDGTAAVGGKVDTGPGVSQW